MDVYLFVSLSFIFAAHCFILFVCFRLVHELLHSVLEVLKDLLRLVCFELERQLLPAEKGLLGKDLAVLFFLLIRIYLVYF